MDPQQIPLRDLHLPEPLDWWPLAPGWWILIALVLIGLGYVAHSAWLRWRRNALRRLALKNLARVRRDYDRGQDVLTLVKEMSTLLRRAMLAYTPRDEVAGLTGRDWLVWLDRGLVDRPFTNGPGSMLESLPYQGGAPADEDFDIDGLTDAIRVRLRTPLPEGIS